MAPLFKSYYDRIKDKSIFDLILLSSHDSTAFKFEPGYSEVLSDNDTLTNFATMPLRARRWLGVQSMLEGFSRTQTLDLQQQLECGVRCFDLRLALVRGRLVLNHTIVTDELVDVLPVFANYLIHNPKEIIELQFKWTDTNPDINLQEPLLKTLRESPIGSYIIKRQDAARPIHELVGMDKRVILFVEGPEIDDALDLYAFKNVYHGINVASDKVNDLRSQLENFVRTPPSALFRMEWTLTPNADDIKEAILRGNAGAALKNLTETLPDPLESMKNLLCKVHVLALDFINPNYKLAERLMDYALCSS